MNRTNSIPESYSQWKSRKVPHLRVVRREDDDIQTDHVVDHDGVENDLQVKDRDQSHHVGDLYKTHSDHPVEQDETHSDHPVEQDETQTDRLEEQDQTYMNSLVEHDAHSLRLLRR